MENAKLIRAYILENFLFSTDESRLRDEQSLIGSGTIDSTGILELILFLEQTFGIQVADEEMLPANLDSVARISAFVALKRAAGGG